MMKDKNNIIIIHHKNGGRFAFTDDEILTAIQIHNHIKNVIDQCKYEKKEIEMLSSGNYFNHEANPIDSERYEYLDNLQSLLQFMLDHPEKEQRV